jgi:hypothetical protein
MFKFVFDRRNDARPYPNLAPMMDNPHESYHGMGDTWPRIAPCRLLFYCQDHDYPYTVSYTDESIPDGAFYPVGLSWFDFELDYFGMMADHVLDLLRQGRMRVLFYYHEGDNPFKEQQRLNQLCDHHRLPADCYRFISGNTQARNILNFVYFPDHELFYWRNAVKWNGKSMPGCSYHDRARTRRFTALNRFHKWWRATIMADLHRNHLLDHSYWSYNMVDMGDRFEDNPLEIDSIPGLKSALENFIQGAPYHCDDLTPQQQNSHWTLIPEHYDDAYCHLILETLYDAEQSDGAFLTEKTFKPIRHAQPFVVFGAPNTLTTLRELGYRTFDHVLDNSYDLEFNNTRRYLKTFDLVQSLSQQDLLDWYRSCQSDLLHNQQLFLSSKYPRLNTLSQQLSQ